MTPNPTELDCAFLCEEKICGVRNIAAASGKTVAVNSNGKCKLALGQKGYCNAQMTVEYAKLLSQRIYEQGSPV